MLRTAARLLASGLLGLLLILSVATEARSDQGDLCMPTTGTVSGLQFSQNVNAALQALVTVSSGATAPANACTAAPVTGQFWLDTSGTLPELSIWDGTVWQDFGTVDTATGRWTPPLGGGTDSVASAATTNLWSKPQAYVNVTGTTGITSFGGSAGVTGSMKVVNFVSALTITYDATSMILPGSTSITTQAGDKAVVVNLGGNNAAVVAYTRRDGTAVAPSSLFSSAVQFTGVIDITGLTGTTNNWNPAGLATAVVVRATATSNATITGMVAQSAGTLIFLYNPSLTTSITLPAESALSTAANRWAFGVDFIMGPRAGIFVRYDSTFARWVVVGSHYQVATTAQADAGTDNSTVMTPSLVAREIETGYRLLAVRGFTSSQTYTPTAGTRYIQVFMTGGGGGGGGAPATSLGNAKAGGGGGGGAQIWYFTTSPAVSAIVIGVGGTGSSGNGSGGGTSSFGSVANAFGGSGGTGAAAGVGTNSGRGGAGGSASLYSILAPGQPGDSGVAAQNGYYIAAGGTGGGGYLGTGGGRGGFEGDAGGASSNGGSTSTNWGGGGGGGSATDGGGAASGGNGVSGIVIVYEYN